MDSRLILYHGSQQMIEKPLFGYGNVHNDYGLGFYCTESEDLACEWACTAEYGGFANRYELDTRELSILRLTNGEYHILNWIAILLENRTFRIREDIALRAKEYILEHFSVDYKAYDVITGYRADDSYFSFATAFLNNTISLKQLEKAMALGKLGEQIVLRTERAFEALSFQEARSVDKEVYYPRKMARDTAARKTFRAEKNLGFLENEVYVLDIMRGRWQNDDPRLQRVVFR